ncbi:MAG: hypothetical protein WBH47_22395, partial [Streptosporangiaceae bacterium]
MRSPMQQPALPGRAAAADWFGRIRRFIGAAPLPVKILVIALVVIFATPLVSVALLVALGYAPFALYTGERSVLASVCVTLWGIAAVAALARGAAEARYLLLLLPVAVAAASHVGVLGRWSVPCRTVAWALLWSLPVGLVTFRILRSQPLLGPATAWPLAVVVLGWRLVKALQDSRQYGRSTTGVPLASPYALAAAGPAPGPAGAAAPVPPPGYPGLPG